MNGSLSNVGSTMVIRIWTINPIELLKKCRTKRDTRHANKMIKCFELKTEMTKITSTTTKIL
jgi:hypothetical protein